MVSGNDKSLIEKLSDALESRNVSVPVFEEKTGIKKDRVYKWLQRKTSKISVEDADKIKEFIEGLDRIPRETGQKGVDLLLMTGDMEHMPPQVERNLSLKAISDLTESNKKMADTVSRLVYILEIKFGVKEPLKDNTASVKKGKIAITKGEKENAE